jgi:hypothetical protein
LALIGNGQDPLDESRVLRRLHRGVPEERSDYGYSKISTAHTVFATTFQIVEECADQWGVQIFQLDLGGRLTQLSVRELQQDAECVPVGSDCVLARSALCNQSLGKERFQ